MAGGNFAGGIGTLADPFLIEDAEDLNAIRRNMTASYRLVNNINLGIPPYNHGAGWSPIPGNFNGNINGNRKSILNLFINRQSTSNIGLFSNIQASTISDLGFVNANVTGDSRVGILSGNASGITGINGPNISRCFFKGTVSSNNGNVGGVIGDINIQNFIMSHVFVGVAVHSFNSINGGIAGIANTPNAVLANAPIFDFIIQVGAVTGNTASSQALVGSHNFNRFTNCIFNSSFNSRPANSGTTGLSTSNMLLASSFPNFEPVLVPGTSTHIWNFPLGQNPRLYFDGLNFALILASGKYLRHNNGVWQEVASCLPTREEFLQFGMNNFDRIPLAAWNQLKSHGMIEIVSMVEKAGNASIVASTRNLVFSREAGNKNIFTGQFNFADFGDGIFNIKSL